MNVLGHPAPVVATGSSFYIFMLNLDTQRNMATYKGCASHPPEKMQHPLHMGGRLLETVPDALSMKDPQSRTCCGALSCFGCVYCMDLFCTLPTMRLIEEGDYAYDMRRLPFYEACWPCMRCLLCSGLQDADELRTVSSEAACPWPSCGICDYIFELIT